MDLMDKLQILSDAAKYDVACTSSGSERKGKRGAIGNTVAPGICHTFSADGRCISLLKILYTNHCVFDCKYCINRSSNDVVRTSFTPEEVCTLTIEFYRRNYIEGLFLSSGIKNSPDETMSEIVQTLVLLREKHHFNGYIHCKAIPGADPDLTELAGWYADRMSVNLELPTAQGLRALAPHKNRKSILRPMRQIQMGIEENMRLLGVNDSRGQYWYTQKALGRLEGRPRLSQSRSVEQTRQLPGEGDAPQEEEGFPQDGNVPREKERFLKDGKAPQEERFPRDGSMPQKKEELFWDGSAPQKKRELSRPAAVLRMSPKGRNMGAGGSRFVPAGQSTQMIIGATGESDYQILSVAEALYRKFDLKRVFYSAFIRVNDDTNLPMLLGGPPLRREHRLYQADWLLRYYGFEAAELLSEGQPNFNEWVDPKCDWAIRHLEQFPVEISKADYYTLLRVPGIGIRSAKRIVEARRLAKLDFADLKKVGVVLKRAVYFITCSGKMYYPMHVTEGMILQNLLMLETLPKQSDALSFQQLSLFDLEQLGGKCS